MALTVSDILDSDEPVQPVRLMSYGPIEGEHTRATNYGPQGNRLGPYDVAVSPDTGFRAGDILNTGDGIYRRAADASYFSPGRPTSHTIELRDKHDQGSGYAKRVTVNDILGPEQQPQAQAIPSPTLSQEVGPPQPVAPATPEQPWYQRAYAAIRNNAGGLADEGKIAFPVTGGQVRPESAALNAQIDAYINKPDKFGTHQKLVDLNNPYSLVPGIPPGLIPELAKLPGGIGDYVKSQFPQPTKPESKDYASRALGAVSELPTDVANYVATPAGLGTVAAYESGVPLVRLALNLGFTTEAVQDFIKSGTLEDKVKAATMAALTGTGALHEAGGLMKEAPRAEVPAPEAAPAPQAPSQTSPFLDAIAAELDKARQVATGAPRPQPRISPETGQTFYPEQAPTVQGEFARTPGSVTLPDARHNGLPSESNVGGIPEIPVRVKEGQTADRPLGATPGEAGAQTGSPPADAGEGLRQQLEGQINTETGRAERGLDPREEVVRREFGTSVEMAQKKAARFPDAGSNLVEKLQKSPKAVSDPDHVLIAHEVIKAQNEFDRASKEADANPADVAAKYAAIAADEHIQQAYIAYENAGTGTARGLAIRNVLKAHDYTLPAMQARFRARVLKGEPLPGPLAREIRGYHDQMAEADKVLEAEGKAYAGLEPEDLKNAGGIRLFAGLPIPEREKKLAGDIKRINKDTANYEARTATKDISPLKPKAEPVMSPEKQAALEKRDAARNAYNQMIARELYKQEPRVKRAINYLVEAARQVKLTGVVTAAKIAAYTPYKLAEVMAGDVAAGVGAAIPGMHGVMMRAPTEGVPTLAGYKGLARGIGQGIKQIPGTIAGKYGQREFAGSPGGKVSKGIIETPARIHAAIKQPLKQGITQMAFAKAQAAAERRGEAGNIGQRQADLERAKEAGSRGILLQNNLITKAYSSGLSALERGGTPGYLASKVAQTLLPIVRIATNIPIESARLVHGIPTSIVRRIALEFKGGLKEATPEQLDLIARNWKIGSIGVPLAVLAYLNRKQISKPYISGAKQQDEENFMGLKGIYAKIVGHNPAVLYMRAVATIGNLIDQGSSGPDAAWKATWAVLNDVPFINLAKRLDDMATARKPTEGAKKFAGQQLSGLVPAVVREAATARDTAAKRYPQTILPSRQQYIPDYLKQDIPGLREQVPSTKRKK